MSLAEKVLTKLPSGLWVQENNDWKTKYLARIGPQQRDT